MHSKYFGQIIVTQGNLFVFGNSSEWFISSDLHRLSLICFAFGALNFVKNI